LRIQQNRKREALTTPSDEHRPNIGAGNTDGYVLPSKLLGTAVLGKEIQDAAAEFSRLVA
jgi:hypothetical protein